MKYCHRRGDNVSTIESAIAFNKHLQETKHDIEQVSFVLLIFSVPSFIQTLEIKPVE